MFEAEAVPDSVQIVVEDAAECEISVNGQRAAYAGLPYYFDRSFHPVDVSNLILQGENVIEVSRHFEAPSLAKFDLASLFSLSTGVELEGIYVIGDFAVKGLPSRHEQKPEVMRYAPTFALAAETGGCTGDLLADGYPFFAGSVTLATSVELDAPAGDESVHLVLPEVGAALCKTRVNGQEAGSVAWAPYELDVTAHIRPGANQV